MPEKLSSVLTPEEMMEILLDEVTPEEMIKRWEDEAEQNSQQT